MTNAFWPWVVLAGLGAYHGLNPAMGWLFAVALGLHRRHRNALLGSLIPLAFGHAAAIALTIVIVGSLGWFIPGRTLNYVAGGLLVGWGVYHLMRSPQHSFRVGMRTGRAGLALWSMLMGLAHGAGLMLFPVFSALQETNAAGDDLFTSSSLVMTFIGIGVHSLAMIAVAGLVAISVYEWIGVGILRRSWVNLDWLWSGALVIAGLVVIASS